MASVRGALVVACIISAFLAWWESYPIHNTAIIFGVIFLGFMAVALYWQKAREQTGARKVIAKVKGLAATPDAATLMPNLAELWTRIENETWWAWWSNETINLYRKIDQDFRSLQDSLDEDSRSGIESALTEAREILREKSGHI